MKHTLEAQLENQENYVIYVLPVYAANMDDGIALAIQFLDGTYVHWIGKHQQFQAMLDKHGFVKVNIAQLDYISHFGDVGQLMFGNLERIKAHLATLPEHKVKNMPTLYVDNGILVK